MNSSESYLLAFARLLMASLFVWDGVLAPESKRDGSIFRQRARTGSRRGRLGLRRHPSAWWVGASGRFQNEMGCGGAGSSLFGHGLWRAPTDRGSRQYDAFL